MDRESILDEDTSGSRIDRRSRTGHGLNQRYFTGFSDFLCSVTNKPGYPRNESDDRGQLRWSYEGKHAIMNHCCDFEMNTPRSAFDRHHAYGT